MKRAAEDLKRASNIEGVVAGVQGEEHLDRLDRPIVVVSNCTHLDCVFLVMIEELVGWK